MEALDKFGIQKYIDGLRVDGIFILFNIGYYIDLADGGSFFCILQYI